MNVIDIAQATESDDDLKRLRAAVLYTLGVNSRRPDAAQIREHVVSVSLGELSLLHAGFEAMLSEKTVSTDAITPLVFALGALRDRMALADQIADGQFGDLEGGRS